MSNAYHTPAYHRYIAEYAADFPLVEEEIEALTLHGLSATWTARHYEAEIPTGETLPNGEPSVCRATRDTGLLTVRDTNGIEYSFDTVDHPLRPIALTLGDRRCILLRRALYGYTLLDIDDLTRPVLDYFPSAVLDGEEAFIFCNAYPLGDLIVLEGCYWASPWLDIFILDPATGRTLHLNAAAGIADVADQSIQTTPDTLSLLATDRDDPTVTAPRLFNLAEIRRLLAAKGAFDL